MTEFQDDLRTAKEDLELARRELLDVVNSLDDADLDRARRGGWPVRRVLEHVIQSEWLYARLALHLRDLPQPEGATQDTDVPSIAGGVANLNASREALVTAIGGVDEETFYRLGTVGHEEYSVLSLLENVVLHDKEHAPQVKDILAKT